MAKQGIMYRFIDGPMTDQEVTMERGLDRVEVGGKGIAALFVYEWAASEGGLTLLAKVRRHRETRRLVMRYIGLKSKHPAVMALKFRRYPVTGRTDKSGQGARRRAAKRA
jgi:hypothetical protein